MAFQKTITHPVPLIGPTEFNAYVKVITVGGSKEVMTIALQYLKDSSIGELIQTKSFDFSPDLDGPNPIKQAYLHLKTLPEFSNAVDC
jgi:hypothetical protein